ncbi:hypothetical protein [Arachidicoccus sp.]|uniref:hypothetical protein n=1 Tax=Arachidicoccus sp. TaxID=1872624 RepID=UPI003D1AC435
MASFCRGIEKEFHLTEILSPRTFLSPKERLIPRQDARKQKLKNDIATILKSEPINSYEQFAQRMKRLGYQIEKGRGIAFMDSKKVRIKGSEVGFSLSKIEKILLLKMEISLKENAQSLLPKQQEIEMEKLNHQTKLSQSMDDNKQPTFYKQTTQIETLQIELKNIIYQIMKPEMGGGEYLPQELSIQKKKKRKQRLRW